MVSPSVSPALVLLCAVPQGFPHSSVGGAVLLWGAGRVLAAAALVRAARASGVPVLVSSGVPVAGLPSVVVAPVQRGLPWFLLAPVRRCQCCGRVCSAVAPLAAPCSAPLFC